MAVVHVTDSQHPIAGPPHHFRCPLLAGDQLARNLFSSFPVCTCDCETPFCLIAEGSDLRRRMNDRYTFQHPENPTIQGLSHILWTGKPTVDGADARNAVFYGDKAIDRSPCGTGTSARMAQLAAKGHLKVGDNFVHESIIGSLFKGRVEQAATVGNKPAIVPSIEGWARVTGYNTIFIDDRDPYKHGFQVI